MVVRELIPTVGFQKLRAEVFWQHHPANTRTLSELELVPRSTRTLARFPSSQPRPFFATGRIRNQRFARSFGSAMRRKMWDVMIVGGHALWITRSQWPYFWQLSSSRPAC